MEITREPVAHATTVRQTRRGAAVGGALGLVAGLVVSLPGTGGTAVQVLGMLLLMTAGGVGLGVAIANKLLAGQYHEDKRRSIGLLLVVSLAAMAAVVVGALLAA